MTTQLVMATFAASPPSLSRWDDDYSASRDPAPSRIVDASTVTSPAEARVFIVSERTSYFFGSAGLAGAAGGAGKTVKVSGDAGNTALTFTLAALPVRSLLTAYGAVPSR
ncbi:hypothetical protein BH10PLA2_BH10PLA2_28990 [soil metagenome]